MGQGRYLCKPEGDNAPPPYEVEIEDALMKPPVSGAEAKRYVDPITNTYLLFPHEIGSDGVRLIAPAAMQATYPKAWSYLMSYRDELRLREVKHDHQGNVTEAPFDDGQWYRFGRHQSLDKQEIKKLIVAQTVPEMRVVFDDSATMYLNNVRVNGIIVAEEEDPWFLLGVLNANVADFVFRRIAKVKAGGFFEANKQFIAPLPIPPVSDDERALVATTAEALQSAHTARSDTLEKIARRLSAARTRNKPETWLFPELKSKRDLIADAPARLDSGGKWAWAEQRYNLDLAARYEAITSRLRPGASLAAAFKDGELSVAVAGVPIVDRIFVDDAEGEFVLAQWKLLAATFTITEKTDGKKLASALRKLVVTDNPALVQQIVALEAELSERETKISCHEAEMNACINRLYGLTEAEAQMIAKG